MEEDKKFEVPAGKVISLQGHNISTKLDDANYLIWKQQIVATIEGFGLEKFLYGCDSVPEKFTVSTPDKIKVLNAEYVQWRRQDQLITSWLLASMTEGVLVGVVGLGSSKDIWDTLAAGYSSQSRAKLMQMKLQLQTLKKGGQTMREYLNKIKACCDVLAAAGEQVTEENQLLHIMAGLGQEYNPVMVSVTSRAEPCSLREVKALLLSYENRLEMTEHSSVSIEGSTPTANVVSGTSSSNNGRFSGHHTSYRGPNQSNFGRGGGRNSNYRGRGGRYNPNYKPRCQICRVLGHTADRCHERHNPNFSYEFSGRSEGQSNKYNGSQNMGGMYSHDNHNIGSNPSAHVAAMNSNQLDAFSAMNWYPDSGASHHVTHDVGNLSMAGEYQGGERLQVGNGAGSSNQSHSAHRNT